MSGFFAALPMYDWPENRSEVDAEWAQLRVKLTGAGIDAPEKLVRRNAEMPAVPGGIRDASGVIAPDPATLPPDELDFSTLWRHPKLLFAQTCWGPMELGLAKHVRVVGQPDYSAFEGGDGELYSSAIVMPRGFLDSRSTLPPSGLPAISPSRGEITPSAGASPIANGAGEALAVKLPISSLEGEMAGRPEGGVLSPTDGKPRIPLDLLRDKRFAFNSEDSMSGIIALTRDLAAMGESLDIFAERVESGGHRQSIIAVAEGRADVATIDCRSWALAQRFEPRSRDVVVVGWTTRRLGLPYIAALGSPVMGLAE